MALNIPKATPAVVEYHALRGSYGRVTYFVTKAALRDIAENLQLAPQQELSFSERIQRVINEDRVREEILPYLQSNDLRFFNALVCILLPDDDKSSPFWGFDEYEDDAGNSLGGLGKLKIAKRVGRIVLDGQHRFRALRDLWDSVKADPDCEDAQIEVSLIFVVVDDLGRFGTTQNQLRSRTVEVVRNLFAVLNKTARRVDSTTLLLIDDTDIANVMTRTLLEQGLIDETFVKWSGAQNLNPQDPFFTVLHVIKDAVRFFLRDFREVLDQEYGSESERKAAMKEYFLNTPRREVPVAKAIPEIVNSCAPLMKWKGLLKKLRIELPKQPEPVELTREQSKALKEVRENSLAYTVAGQKVFFRAVIEYFLDQKRRNMASLRTAIKRGNIVLDNNLFVRSEDDDNPFYGLLFQTRGRMNWAEYAVENSRRILGKALGSSADENSILQDYEKLTERDVAVVKRYWAKVRKALEQV